MISGFFYAATLDLLLTSSILIVFYVKRINVFQFVNSEPIWYRLEVPFVTDNFFFPFMHLGGWKTSLLFFHSQVIFIS